MRVIVTGAGGFLGERVADALLGAPSPLGAPADALRLLLVDEWKTAPRDDPRVQVLALDLAARGAAERVLAGGCDVLFHLAAVVSGHAEADFDLGMRVNLDATRAQLEAARRLPAPAPAPRLVFASTVGVFGGALPPVVGEQTATQPQSSYGAAKAMCELLVNEYGWRGLVDARAVRLPTVSVRAGAPNRAVTSFASGVVREPLAGVAAVCPVPAELPLWVCSPRAAVANLVHAATLPASALGAWRVLSLPGLTVTPRDMVAALRAAAPDPRAAELVRFERDDAITALVSSFPSRFDTARALALGFVADTDFEEVVRAYIRDDLNGTNS